MTLTNDNFLVLIMFAFSSVAIVCAIFQGIGWLLAEPDVKQQMTIMAAAYLFVALIFGALAVLITYIS